MSIIILVLFVYNNVFVIDYSDYNFSSRYIVIINYNYFFLILYDLGIFKLKEIFKLGLGFKRREELFELFFSGKIKFKDF